MKIICFIAGCRWAAATPMLLGSEQVLCQCCSRCGSSRIASLAASPGAALLGGAVHNP